jgi:hypothetical protein
MIFLGIGFLLSFLRRYSYSSIVFCLLIGVYVTEWSLSVRGWLEFEKMDNLKSVYQSNLKIKLQKYL